MTTVREILLAGGRKDLRLVHEGEQTEGRVSISCQFFQFENSSTSFSNSNHKGDGLLCGLATVLIASASGIKGQRDQLTPSVVVTWGTIGKILPYLRCMLILCPFVFRFEASLPNRRKDRCSRHRYQQPKLGLQLPHTGDHGHGQRKRFSLQIHPHERREGAWNS